MSDYYIKNNLLYLLTEDEYQNIETKIIINDKSHDELGSVKIFLKDKLIHEETIYLKNKNAKIKKEGLLKKVLNFLKNIFK